MLKSACFVILASHVAVEAHAGLLINGDFETGDLTGWTTYTTFNGSLGSGLPAVSLFNTTGSGTSLAAEFRVGEVAFTGFNSPEVGGGGIYQSFAAGAGKYILSADIAALGIFFRNVDGGTFRLIFDGKTLDSFDIGAIEVTAVTRHRLSATLDGVSAGNHEIRIEMVRHFVSGNSAPLQFLDNVSVSAPAPPAPEPSSMLGGVIGTAIVFSGVIRHRSARRRSIALSEMD